MLLASTAPFTSTPVPESMPTIRHDLFADGVFAARLQTERALGSIGSDSSLAISQATKALSLLERAFGFDHPVELNQLVFQAATYLKAGARQLAVDVPTSEAAARMHWTNALERFAAIDRALTARPTSA